MKGEPLLSVVPILDLETGNGSVEEVTVVSDQNGVVLNRGGGEQQINLAALTFGATGSLGLGSISAKSGPSAW